jgi:hypothetical protein
MANWSETAVVEGTVLRALDKTDSPQRITQCSYGFCKQSHLIIIQSTEVSDRSLKITRVSALNPTNQPVASARSSEMLGSPRALHKPANAQRHDQTLSCESN